AESAPLHAGGGGGEAAAAAVEAPPRPQVLLAAVDEVRGAQPDVAEARRLEGAVIHARAALRERGAVRAQAGPAWIFSGRTHPDVVEALIATVLVDGSVLLQEVDRCFGQVSSGGPLAPRSLTG